MGLQHANRIEFKRGYQRKFFDTMMNKLDLRQRALAKRLNVSRNSLKSWIEERWLLPENIFFDSAKILPELLNYKKYIINIYPGNWGRIKGGKARGKMKSNLTQAMRIKGFRKANLNTVKRKVIGPKEEKMYNDSERKLAELLLKQHFRYQYEPAIKLGKKYAFPDFLVKNTIIERCGYSDWPGYWNRIIQKTELYKRYFKGKFIILVPPERFNIAMRRMKFHLKNVIILNENEIDKLPSLIM